MARCWLLLAIFGSAALAHAQPGPVRNQKASKKSESFYRYKNKGGREVFTNAAESVPVEQRAEAKMDLSRVSLNTELGNEIERKLEREHAALTKTPYCEEARKAAAIPFWEELWNEYSALVVAAGVLLFLLLISPWAMQKFGVAGWQRALGMAIPVVFASGLMVFALDKTQRSISTMRSKAAPCDSGALAALGRDPGVLQKHAELIDRLKRDMASVDLEAGLHAGER